MATSSIAYNAGIMASIASALMLLIGVPLFQRYITRKKKNTLFLAISIVSLGLSSLFVTQIYFFAEERLQVAIWCQKLVYVGVFLAVMFTFQFSQEIFFTIKDKYIKAYWVIGMIMIILTLALDSVVIDEFPDGTGYPLLTIGIEFSAMVVVFLIPTVLIMIYRALKTAKKIDEKAYKFGFRLIAIATLMILATFIVDTVATMVMDDLDAYATCLYLTWVFPIIGCMGYYLGYIMPNWLRRIFGIEEEKR